MFRIGDLLSPVVGAPVASDLREPVQDPDAGGLGEDHQVLTDRRGGDGVVIVVEADPQGLSAAHGNALCGVKSMPR